MATFDLLVSRVTGPLAAHAAGFAAELTARGYAASSVRQHLGLMAELSRWLADQGLDAGRVSSAAAGQFAAVMRARRRSPVSARGLAPVLGYLRDVNVAPVAGVAAASGGAREMLLAAFRQYLRCERGVCERTVFLYAPYAASFLARLGDPLPQALLDLTGAQVLGIVSDQLRHGSAADVKQIATVDRVLLRFLHATGRVPASLTHAVPAVAQWRLAGLPRRLDTSTVAALLDSCDRGTELGARDYAAMLLSARLGLRRGEVAMLTLGDVHWRIGELTVGGKGGRRDRLPLPWDVGGALADYLRIRRPPRTATRAVFLTVRAPRKALSRRGVAAIVPHACQRAGISPCGGAHALRHTLASDLLAAGASLADVGELLRHVNVATTAIYAKVDRAALAVLIRPWPALQDGERR